MICPSCQTRECAEGRKRCWPCLDSEMSTLHEPPKRRSASIDTRGTVNDHQPQDGDAPDRPDTWLTKRLLRDGGTVSGEP